MQCPFETTDPTTSEVLVKILDHGRSVHQITDPSQNDLTNFLKAIKK